MEKHEDDQNVTNEESSLVFLCPNDGEISRDDVIFLCNTCGRDEIIEKEGVYMCPSCLAPGENFECLICESRDVKMKTKK